MLGYTTLDLLDKIIYVVEKKKNICGVKLENTKNNTRIYVIAKVFMKNLDKSIAFTKDLKEEIKKTEMEEIDFIVYDKISFSIDEFSSKIVALDILDIESIFEYCLDFQKDILALCTYIQGKIVQREEDMDTSTYKALNTMIVEKKKQVKKLEDFYKKYY